MEQGLRRTSQEGIVAAYRWPLLLIVAVCATVYINALANGFVYDDLKLVVSNPLITDVRHIPEIFATNMWDFQGAGRVSNYYRPLMHVSSMLTYHLFGLASWAFHLVGILLHTAASVLVFFVGRELFRRCVPPVLSSTAPALTAALLFAVHPIHTDAVTWIACLMDVAYAFFSLLSLYLYMRLEDGNRGNAARHVLSVASFFLATLCKEPALTLPIIFAAYDFAFRRGSNRLSDCLKRYIPYVVAAGVYLALRINALGGFAPLKRHGELSAYENVINAFPLFTEYLAKLVLPTNLNAFHVLHPISSIFELRGIVAIAVTAAFMAVTVVTAKKSKLVFLSLIMVAAPLLPVLYIPGVAESSLSERSLYFPSVGFALLTALLIERTRSCIPGGKVLSASLAIFLLATYSVATIRRNEVWKDNYTLWIDTVEKSPDGAIPHVSLGYELLARGQTEEAIRHFQTAIRLRPRFAEAHINLGLAYYKIGRLDLAENEYLAAVALNPGDHDAHYNLGIVYQDKGLLDQAIAQYEEAIRLFPRDADVYDNMGIAYERKGMTGKAVEMFQAAVRLNPTEKEFSDNLARVAAKLK